ncbi:hypothetical protein C8J55DRAFT_505921 [Lentinula edodes]|uniref:Uncharacterized protein n=1 Tax=Lentinula lateritia TaxID=40482 RepID=A0A9W9AR41_9AGAR|nr:hypothetical protein C8J55DRAFT_505921 [Lentinula edodes]
MRLAPEMIHCCAIVPASATTLFPVIAGTFGVRAWVAELPVWNDVITPSPVICQT